MITEEMIENVSLSLFKPCLEGTFFETRHKIASQIAVPGIATGEAVSSLGIFIF